MHKKDQDMEHYILGTHLDNNVYYEEFYYNESMQEEEVEPKLHSKLKIENKEWQPQQISECQEVYQINLDHQGKASTDEKLINNQQNSLPIDSDDDEKNQKNENKIQSSPIQKKEQLRKKTILWVVRRSKKIKQLPSIFDDDHHFLSYIFSSTSNKSSKSIKKKKNIDSLCRHMENLYLGGKKSQKKKFNTLIEQLQKLQF